MIGENQRRFVGNGQQLFAPSIQAGLVHLAEASDYAVDVRAEPGEFAVEFRGLTANGVTRSDLAWLVRNGYVVHAREVTRPDDPARRFRPAKSLRFTETSCFIATAEGMALTTVERLHQGLRRAA